jgi:hypothetical protein
VGKAKVLVAVALLAAGVVALLLLVLLLAWNTVAGPWIGGVGLLTLVLLFLIGVGCLAGGGYLIFAIRKRR